MKDYEVSLVISTKFTSNFEPKIPHADAGGNTDSPDGLYITRFSN